jgi:hypothetical protein
MYKIKINKKKRNETHLSVWNGRDLRRRFRNPFRLRQKKGKTAMIFLCLSLCVCVEKLRITSEKGHTRRRNYKAI